MKTSFFSKNMEPPKPIVTDNFIGDPNPWYEYKDWKIWNVPESNYFVCIRDDAGKVLEVDRTLPISHIVRTLEQVLDDRDQTPSESWQQIRQIVAERKAAFWTNLLNAARTQSSNGDP
ncbi:MAG: hypothetical protein WBA24_09515 [Geitlerinemataceae cyanobacterium]